MKLKQIRVDGYKNLIDCVVNLGDFNIFVGPNNSGKSNLMEAVQMIWPICFGDEKLRKSIFGGLTPRFTDSSICHLSAYKNKPIKIGLVFDMNIRQKLWHVDYELCIKCESDDNSNGGFIYEKLEAKLPSNTGPSKKYIERNETKLKVNGKEWLISKSNSSIVAITSLYPEYKDLPSELKHFVKAIELVSLRIVYSVSPQDLRNGIGREKPIEGLHVSSFDLNLILDGLTKNEEHFKLFKDTLCDILDLEAVHFETRDIPIRPKKEDGKETLKRVRLLFIERKGSKPAPIEEFSDGTFATAAILAVLLSEHGSVPVLFIEEPENYLHPAALEKLIRFLQYHANKWPVLITTHSPFLLNLVNPADVNITVVDETTGATHFEKITDRRKLNAILNNKFMSFGDELINNFEDLLKTKKD